MYVCVSADWKRKIPRDATCAVRIIATEWPERRFSQSWRKVELVCVERALSVLFLAGVSKEPSCGMTFEDMPWEFDIF
jgi:hypothetical protein